MKREKELAKNTIILSLGKFVPKLFSLVTLPIITEQLTKAEYGTYDLVLNLVSLLLPITTLQIQSAAFRFLIDCRENMPEKKKIITNILSFTLPVSLVVLAVMALVLPNMGVTVRLLICLYFLADIMTSTLGQIARGLSYNLAYAVSAVLLSLTNACVIVFTLAFRQMGLEGVLLAAAVANLLSVFYLAWKIKLWQYWDRKVLSREIMKKMLAYSLPMVPNNLSSWVLKISDRLVITWAWGVEANAIYAVANKLPDILNIARSTFVMAWQENAAIASKDEDAAAYYSKMFDMIYSFVIGITALLIAATPLLFKFFIRGDYESAYFQMPILYLGIFFGCISAFQGGIYVAFMKTRSVGITTMFAAACNLLLDLLLVKKLGITAGSLSTLISYFILFVYRMFDVRKIQHIEYKYGKLAAELAVVAGMAFLCYRQVFWTDCVNGVIGCLFCAGINWKMGKTLLHVLAGKKESESAVQK